jgi:predicted permease
VVATLGLGIGANASLFSLLDSIVLRELPIKDPHSLFAIHRVTNDNAGSISFETFEVINQRQSAFAAVAGWTTVGATTVANGTIAPSILDGVTGEYFSLLGLRPILGRLFDASDTGTRVPSSAVAVLSYRFWQKRYNSDRTVIGKTINVQGITFTIVGIAPKDYTGLQVGSSTDLTVPLAMIQAIKRELNIDATEGIAVDYILGRLHPGIGIGQAQAQLDSIWTNIRSTNSLAEASPQDSKLNSDRLSIESASTGFSSLRGQLSNSLLIVFLIAVAVLLLSCLNLASSMAVLGTSRRYETALRVALGAPRGRLVRQVLMESLLLSTIGTSIAVVLACVGTPLLGSMLTQIYAVPSDISFSPDIRLLLFLGISAIVTGTLIGLGAAWRSAREHPRAALQEGLHTIVQATTGISKTLIIIQLAVTLVLLEAAGMFTQNLLLSRDTPLGFKTRNILEVMLLPRPRGYDNLDDESYYRTLTERLAGLPGITGVSMANMTPGAGLLPTAGVTKTLPSDVQKINAELGLITPGFLSTMGIHILEGRDFTWQDNAIGQRVAIISEGLARRLFPSGPVIGQQIQIEDGPNHHSCTIAGVVNDTRLSDVRRSQPFSVFFPSMQATKGSMEFPVLELATSSEPLALTRAIGREVESLGHEYVLSTSTVDEIINISLLRERLTATLSGFFALLAILLAAIGLFGLLSHSVTRRTREIAIRVAIGASLNSIRMMVLREALLVVSGGIVIGFPCALLVPRAASILIEGLAPLNLSVMVAICLLLLMTSLLACYGPLRKATGVNPSLILRSS